MGKINNNFLLDTNTLIYFFNGLVEDEEIYNILKKSFNISIITKIEFLSWKELSINNQLQKKATEFIENAKIYTLNDEIAKKTIKNRQLYKIKIPDAIIAATAQIYGFKLVTNNVKDFENLNLEIISMKLNIQ
ncbi:type II toxin-antitoxin system VapC family toxin [Aliarcobacter skirrowii]|uniref:type II toxin-antitoxin system VapC family toxin n=1 Tax=Aliarcobacter skirrowii TaxID=28200 RepID=UPI00242D0B1C|nr:type II toxin-antitoxin system VapC family toxin [Aliarcobacter skirrowii]MDD2509169.1 type II toxin-antitoxin system VapC family toxin [Aliarcobacter skirrowii]MDD3496540.1 type II toxin-antitoxin system VapC family toxin [Aliarcobacter skirrowii]MDY0181274.1 type II toxin-antitoxin system VapC family toxin [Aliarcobacter skirrowii]